MDPVPVSQHILIPDPVLSSTPVSIHALTYHSPPAATATATAAAHPSNPDPANPPPPPPVVVFLHYWGGSAMTSHRIPALVHELYRQRGTAPPTMIALSFRGWGRSGRAVPDTPAAYSIRALAADVVAVLGQLIPAAGPDGAGAFVLCGHSMGAKVALQVAAILAANAHPPRLRLQGLLLLAPAPPGPLVVSASVRAQMEHAYDSAEDVRRTLRHVLAADGGKRLEATGEVDVVVRDSLAGSAGARSGWLEVGMGEDVRESFSFAAAADRGVGGDGLGLEVRVLVAGGDRVEPAERVEAETVAFLRGTSMPGVRFRVLEAGTDSQGGEYGHLLPLEAPREIAVELVALLDEVA